MPSINFNFLSNSYSYLTIRSGCYLHWMASQNRWLHIRGSSCILQLTANAWQTILISHHYHEIHFLIFILMMAPNSSHLIQISIVEEYRIFRTINLDKNDDFVHSTTNVYLYFAVGLFLNKKTRIIDVLGVIFYLNKAIKVY